MVFDQLVTDGGLASADLDVVVAAAFEGEVVGEGGEIDASDLARFGEQAFGELIFRAVGLVAGLGKHDGGGPDAVAADTDVERAQAGEVLEEEPGGDEEDEREGDLGDDHGIAGEAPAAAGAEGTAGAAFQLFVEVGAGHLEGGEGAE